MCLPSDGQHEAVTVLPSGIVVDKSKTAKMSADEMSAFFAELYSRGRPVIIIENGWSFFNTKKLIHELEHGGKDWRLIAEHFNIVVHPDDIATLTRAVEIRALIAEQVKKIKPTYEMAAVPAGWDLHHELQMDAARVIRRNGHYSIGWKQLERLWLAASAHWSGAEGSAGQLSDVRAEGTSRRAVFYSKTIEVGCQTIQRYEIEQLAQFKGWAFP